MPVIGLDVPAANPAICLNTPSFIGWTDVLGDCVARMNWICEDSQISRIYQITHPFFADSRNFSKFTTLRQP